MMSSSSIPSSQYSPQLIVKNVLHQTKINRSNFYNSILSIIRLLSSKEYISMPRNHLIHGNQLKELLALMHQQVSNAHQQLKELLKMNLFQNTLKCNKYQVSYSKRAQDGNIQTKIGQLQTNFQLENQELNWKIKRKGNNQVHKESNSHTKSNKKKVP